MQKLVGLALLLAAAACLPAATISGQFTLDGTVIVTNGGLIEWVSNTDVGSEANISASGTLTGSFVGLGGQSVTINTLTDGPNPATQQPVNTPFTNYNFIDFTSQSTFPELLANFLPLGSAGGADCSTNVALAAADQTCTLTGVTTPPIPGGSPFTFLNTATSINQHTTCCTSSATWNISGVTSDGLSAWNGQFTATFATPYQTVLADFVNNGEVSDAYSGVMVVTVSSIQNVPEPTTWAFMGTGLVLLWVGSRRRKKA